MAAPGGATCDRRGAPFPDVAAGVVKAVLIGGQAADILRGTAVTEVAGDGVLEAGIADVLIPLGLRRQGIAVAGGDPPGVAILLREPFAEAFGLVPRDVFDRSTGAGKAAGVLAHHGLVIALGDLVLGHAETSGQMDQDHAQAVGDAGIALEEFEQLGRLFLLGLCFGTLGCGSGRFSRGRPDQQQNGYDGPCQQWVGNSGCVSFHGCIHIRTAFVRKEQRQAPCQPPAGTSRLTDAEPQKTGGRLPARRAYTPRFPLPQQGMSNLRGRGGTRQKDRTTSCDRSKRSAMLENWLKPTRLGNVPERNPNR